LPLGSFGIFETFRILIPGYLAALYASWYLALFFPTAAGYLSQGSLSTVTFIGFGLLAGLLLYLMKLPNDPDSVVRELPSTWIREHASELNHPINSEEATDIYFYLLNNYFSDSMRERIFFFGNIYRVTQKIWLISFTFGALSIVTALAQCLACKELAHLPPKLAYAVVLAAVGVAAHRYAAIRYIPILYGQKKWLKMRQKLVDAFIADGIDDYAKPEGSRGVPSR
jgi:hypothetical protein